MSSRTVYLSHLDKTVRLGRTRPKARCPRLKLSRYLNLGLLPSPPAAYDYSPAASKSLSQMYLNDQLGDCVIACMAHVVGLLTANAGGPEVLFTQQQIVSLYGAVGGYVPGNPNTDQGCNEQDALNYWMHNGAPAGGTKILGWLAVDPKNVQEYSLACWLFEHLIYGIGLPDQWLQNVRPDFVWDAATPDQNNGHCIAAVGRTAQGMRVATWGMLGTLTDAAHARDVEELYVALDQDMVNKATQKAPNALDWAALVADFDALGGHVPVPPAPGPTPVPPVPVPPAPVPPGPVPAGPSLAQVQSVCDAEFKILERQIRGPGVLRALDLGRQSLDAQLSRLFGQ